MREIVSFNGVIQPVSDAQIHAVSAAALYGFGVFTTVAVYNRKPFLWHLHQKRLQDNAAKIGLNQSAIDFDRTENDLLEFIAACKIERGRARVTLFDAGASDVWRFETNRQTEVFIIADDAPEKPKSDLRLTVSPFPINSSSPLAGIKSCNYLENLLAWRAAGAAGFDETVRLNERGEVVSAAMANLFWIKDETVFTPALATGALAGTTREFVIENLRAAKFEVLELKYSLESLAAADEIFLTSAVLGVGAVSSLNGKSFRSVLAAKLRKELIETAAAN